MQNVSDAGSPPPPHQPPTAPNWDSTGEHSELLSEDDVFKVPLGIEDTFTFNTFQKGKEGSDLFIYSMQHNQWPALLESLFITLKQFKRAKSIFPGTDKKTKIFSFFFFVNAQMIKDNESED